MLTSPQTQPRGSWPPARADHVAAADSQALFWAQASSLGLCAPKLPVPGTPLCSVVFMFITQD